MTAVADSGLISSATKPPIWVTLASSLIPHLPAGRYRLAHFFRRYSRGEFLMNMRRELGGYSFTCNLHDTISREVCFTGQYEPQETALVRSILRPGMTFVDVGANWGYFTLVAASLVGESGRVLSLEPDPRLFPILTDNITRSRLSQVTALRLAAADKLGTLTLAGYDPNDDNFGVSHIIRKGRGGPREFQVKTDSLDQVLAQQGLESVDLMKMDIEGAEAFAIDGLLDSLRSMKVKRLMLELHPRQLAEHGSSAQIIFEKIQEAGYTGLTIDHSLATSRYAAYSKRVTADKLLRPFEDNDQLDAWPHLLWQAPSLG